MKLLLKSALLLVFTVGLVYFINGCNTAEETTALIAYNGGDYQKAETEFLAETKQNPNNEEAWFYLAMSRVKLNKPDGVKEAMDQYRKIGKNTFQSELVKEWDLVFDAGYKRFQIASSMKGDSAIPQYQAAINSFKLCTILLPDSTLAQKNIDIINNKVHTIALKPILDQGVALEGQGDFAGAIEHYKKALDLAGTTGQNHEIVVYDLGVGYLKWGEKIRDSLRAANSEDQSFKDQYKLALPYLEELTASKDAKTQLQSYQLLVQVYGNLGMIDKANEAMKKVQELGGDNNK